MLKLDKLLKHSADLIDHRRQGRFVDVSQAALVLLGYTPVELCARSYTDFIDPADRSVAAGTLAEVFSRVKLQIQNHYLHKCGQVVLLRWSAQWDQDDQVLYAIARSRQITDLSMFVFTIDCFPTRVSCRSFSEIRLG